MDEAEELAGLKIHSPSSHVALSGDFTVFIAKTEQLSEDASHNNELNRVGGEDGELLDNFPNESPLLR